MQLYERHQTSRYHVRQLELKHIQLTADDVSALTFAFPHIDSLVIHWSIWDLLLKQMDHSPYEKQYERSSIAVFADADLLFDHIHPSQGFGAYFTAVLLVYVYHFVITRVNSLQRRQYIADFKYMSLSPADRNNKAVELRRDRCLQSLKFSTTVQIFNIFGQVLSYVCKSSISPLIYCCAVAICSMLNICGFLLISSNRSQQVVYFQNISLRN
ncbi:hypothetical protein BDF20DRAFT_988147 [Mycotypha africana]|uniref:uncharacterized protein n=1 Tax=Mycotypha africana TaxID=64632 RepID=UPI002300C852|nr:uncharacterized protein BDF20DRAFT_988147 [Mycotypha africana]KAI8977128.1 hypothetical protein BDF20DRAFT_988147 [Mycotypha africana]